MFSFASGTHAPLYSQGPALSTGLSTGLLRGEVQSNDVTLNIRQQPKEALVTTEGKEKARKPVDPPPIVEISVRQSADPQQHWLQSPYLFMCASLHKADKDEAWDGNANKSLAGTLVSSLHRLKDVDNKDGGFFVFGDVSVKQQGTFRLHFSLFELRKDNRAAEHLASITSDPFKVLLAKDFKGMDESTYLSRAFSDQGVRLRLRKESRAMIGNKRSYSYGAVSPSSNTPIRPNPHDYSSFEELPSANKRPRSDTVVDTKRETYSQDSGVSGVAYTPSYPSPQYTSRQPPAVTGGFPNNAQYPTFGNMQHPLQYRFHPNIPSSTNYPDMLPNPIPGSSAGTMANYPHSFQSYDQYRSSNTGYGAPGL